MSSAAGRLAEVTVVPDFSGEIVAMFEARTLFFLASWLERYGEGSPGEGRPRVHVCCVGEPPGSVRRMAVRAGARLSVHEPMPGFWGGFANKLRGLEDPGGDARVLLLDVDVLVLGGVEVFDGFAADFAAAAAGKPQVPLAKWEVVYTTLGLDMPSERIPSLRGRLGLGVEAVANPYEGQKDEVDAMPPYYNSGIVLLREGCGLRARWEDHMRRLAVLVAERLEMTAHRALMVGDQVGLATALQSLRAEGRTFQPLPDGCHARLVHLRGGALRWGDIELFHATGFLRELQARGGLAEAVEDYAARWAAAFRAGGGAEADAQQPRRFLWRLWEKWVRPEWECG